MALSNFHSFSQNDFQNVEQLLDHTCYHAYGYADVVEGSDTWLCVRDNSRMYDDMWACYGDVCYCNGFECCSTCYHNAGSGFDEEDNYSSFDDGDYYSDDNDGFYRQNSEIMYDWSLWDERMSFQAHSVPSGESMTSGFNSVSNWLTYYALDDVRTIVVCDCGCKHVLDVQKSLDLKMYVYQGECEECAIAGKWCKRVRKMCGCVCHYNDDDTSVCGKCKVQDCIYVGEVRSGRIDNLLANCKEIVCQSGESSKDYKLLDDGSVIFNYLKRDIFHFSYVYDGHVKEFLVKYFGSVLAGRWLNRIMQSSYRYRFYKLMLKCPVALACYCKKWFVCVTRDDLDLKAEAWTDYLPNVFKDLVALPTKIGEASESVNDVCGKATDLMDSLANTMLRVGSSAEWMKKVFDFLIYLRQLSRFEDSLYDKVLAVYALLKMVWDLFTLFVQFIDKEALFFGVDADVELQANALDFGSMLTMTAIFEHVIPKSLRNLLNNLQKYSHVKLLDDVGFISNLFSTVLSVPSFVFGTLADVSTGMIKDMFLSIGKIYDLSMAYVPGSQIQMLYNKLRNHVEAYRKDNRILYDDEFFENFCADFDLFQKMETPFLMNKGLMPRYYGVMVRECTEVFKHGKVVRASTRSEPVMVVFCGPKGTGKSVLMDKLLRQLRKTNSVYTHMTHDQGKDYHDQYRGEDVYHVDDIGQKGVFQWSPFINIVSCAANPLNCSESSLKSTKFFCSELILGTTNNLDLHPIRNDGIESVGALYRRIHQVDFSGVRFDDGKYSGNFKYLKFDINSNRWRILYTFPISGFFPWFVRDILSQIAKNKQIAEDIKKESDENDYGIPNLHAIKGSDITKFLQGDLLGQIDGDSEEEEEDELFASCDQDYPHGGEIRSHGVCDVSLYNDETLPKVDIMGQNLPFPQGSIFNQLSDDMKLSAESLDLMRVCVRCSEGTETMTERDYMDHVCVNKCKEDGERPMELICNCKRAITTATKFFLETSEKCWEKLTAGAKIVRSKSGVDKVAKYIGSGLKRIYETPLDEVFHGAINLLACSVILQNVVSSLIVYLMVMGISKCVKLYYEKSHRRSTDYYVPVWKNDAHGRVKIPMNLVANGGDTVVDAINKNVLQARLFFENGRQSDTRVVFVDANKFIVNYHSLYKNGVFIRKFIMQASRGDVRLIDGSECEVIDSDVYEDFCLCTFTHSHVEVFRKISHHFLREGSLNKNLFLLTGDKVVSLNDVSVSRLARTYFDLNDSTLKVEPDSLVYEQQGKGLCGSLVVNGDGYVVGWHVAGDDGTGLGFARVLRQKQRESISKCVFDGCGYKEDYLSDVSRIRIDNQNFSAIPKKTRLSPSVLHGVFYDEEGTTVERAPAQLSGKNKEGVSVVEHAVKKNFGKCNVLDCDGVDFAMNVVASIFEDEFDMLTHEETIKGMKNDDGDLPQINKKSSSGYPYKGMSKEELINFETCEVHPLLKENIDKIRECAESGRYPVELSVFNDCLKDEPRDVEKVDKPRLFAVGNLHTAYWLKRIFGKAVASIQRNRLNNGIMIGLNCQSEEWQKFHDFITSLGFNLFDGDWGKWDGKMLKQIQEALTKVLSRFSKHGKFAKFLLDLITSTVHSCLGESYVSTHSIPSGHGLTAIFNSLVNLMYCAYIFYKLALQHGEKPTVAMFFQKTRHGLYGDDLLANASPSIPWYNAVNFQKEAILMGLEFTDANKGTDLKPYSNISEVQFLKRKFYFHPILKRVTAPLALKTLKSTMSWVSDSFRMDELVDDKVGMFQRELFLHPPAVYSELMGVLASRYRLVYGREMRVIPLHELIRLYTAGELHAECWCVDEECSQHLKKLRIVKRSLM